MNSWMHVEVTHYYEVSNSVWFENNGGTGYVAVTLDNLVDPHAEELKGILEQAPTTFKHTQVCAYQIHCALCSLDDPFVEDQIKRVAKFMKVDPVDVGPITKHDYDFGIENSGQKIIRLGVDLYA